MLSVKNIYTLPTLNIVPEILDLFDENLFPYFLVGGWGTWYNVLRHNGKWYNGIRHNVGNGNQA